MRLASRSSLDYANEMEEAGCSSFGLAKKKRLSLRAPRQSSSLQIVDAKGGLSDPNVWKDCANVDRLDGQGRTTDAGIGDGKDLLPNDTPGDSEGRLEEPDLSLKAKQFILDEFCDAEEELPFDVLEEVLSQYDKPAAKSCDDDNQCEVENTGVEGLDFSEHTYVAEDFSRDDEPVSHIRDQDAFDDSSAFRDDLSFDEENCRDPGKAESEELSFRDAFYKGGTDWSSLHEVDEYGLPCARSSSPSSYGRDDAEGYEGVEPQVSSQSRHSQGSFSDNKENQTNNVRKLKQGDLSSFLGFKRKLPPDASVTPKKTEQRDIGTYFGLAPLAKQAASFASKFRPQAASAPASGEYNAQRKGGNGWKSNLASSTRGCPFYKKMPGTPFTVDAFKFGAVEGCRAYFLSHFHSDHYGGLTRSWCHGPIFCTEITARLVSMHLGVDSHWLRPVKLDSLIVVDGVQVKFLEANHCPGAALILFQTHNQRILHTGDFRACKAMQAYPDLLPGASRITSLYLDTTYCNPKYNFPLQEDVIRHVVRLTTAALARNPRTLVAVGAYSIGKERVYLGIAKALNLAIFADKRRARTLRALDWPDLTARLCSDARSSQLHVLPISHLNAAKLRAYMQSFPAGVFSAVLAFRPTGWTFSEKVGCNLDALRPQSCSGGVTIYGVPYSEHSSFSELREFVRFLRPHKIIATVNVGSAAQRESMQAHFNQWLKAS